MKRRPKSARAARTKARELTALLHRLVSVSQSSERLIELYYWSLDPELAEVMRHYITLPNEPRNALRAFLTMTADCAESPCGGNFGWAGHVVVAGRVEAHDGDGNEAGSG